MVFIKISPELNCIKLLRISHESAEATENDSSQILLSFLRCFLQYQKHVEVYVIYMPIVFFPYWNKKLECRQMKAEVRINKLE